MNRNELDKSDMKSTEQDESNNASDCVVYGKCESDTERMAEIRDILYHSGRLDLVCTDAGNEVGTININELRGCVVIREALLRLARGKSEQDKSEQDMNKSEQDMNKSELEELRAWKEVWMREMPDILKQFKDALEDMKALDTFTTDVGGIEVTKNEHWDGFKKVELNPYQSSQMDRQIRVIEALTNLPTLQHPSADGTRAVLLNVTRNMSDIMSGEGSDNNAPSAEPSEQAEYQDAVENFLEKTAPELFEYDLDMDKAEKVILDMSQQKIPPVFFSGEEKGEKLDNLAAIVDARLKVIYDQREEILEAFIAKYGHSPESVEQVEQDTPEGKVWSVRFKEPEEKVEKPLRYFLFPANGNVVIFDGQCHVGTITKTGRRLPVTNMKLSQQLRNPMNIEVTEADLPYLKKPEGDWEFRRPLKDDKYASMRALEKHGRHLFCHARKDWVDPSKGTWDPLNHYRWCAVKGA